MIRTAFACAAALSIAAAAAAAPASAQSTDEGAAPATIAGQSASLGSARSQVTETMLLAPGTSEVGGGLRVLTGGEMAGSELSLTDLSILGLFGRRALGERFEIAVGLDVLVKQPEVIDEPLVQGAYAVGRVAIGERLALAARAAGGPQLGTGDLWGEASLLLQGRKQVHETLVFQGAVGGAQTELFGDVSARLTEVVVGGQALLRTPRGEFGVYAGADYRVPVASGPSELDPSVRLSLAVGTVYAVVPNWTLWVEAAAVDRGDASMPETTLPILDGGRDQRQIVIGVSTHFDDESGDRQPGFQLAY